MFAFVGFRCCLGELFHLILIIICVYCFPSCVFVTATISEVSSDAAAIAAADYSLNIFCVRNFYVSIHGSCVRASVLQPLDD